MIPVRAAPNQKRPKRVAATFRCVTCLQLFTVRLSRNKRSCFECEALRERAKEAAGVKIRAEVKAGKVRPASDFKCADCGKPAKVYDHRDYTKPLDVEPVCVSCNNIRGPARV